MLLRAMVVHRPDELTSLRHLPSWALLSFAAGAVNAGALLACQRFVSHVTGTVTRIGVDAREMLALDYALVLAAFVAGASSAILLARKVGDARRPGYWAPLTAVAVVLVGVALAGTAGWLGPFGGTVETARDFAMLAVLGFAMGMQNAAVAASTAMTVRTTHMTGPATDLGVAFALLVDGDVRERAAARSSALLRATKLFAFVLGGVAMALLCPHAGYASFVLPSVACLIATFLSFAPWRLRGAAVA
jgi:uncharacterized membrane protein YoaK (UPF0700 family)